MRFRKARLLGVPILSLFLSLSLAACSGSQQDQEGLEVQDQEGQYQDNQYNEDNQYNDQQGDNQYASEDNGYGDQEYGNQQGEDSEYASQQLGDENLAEEYDTGSDYAGNETENDLQEIISEMNGEGDVVAEDTYGTDTQDVVDAGAGYAAPAMDTMAAPDPMMAGGATDTMAAAPSVPFQPGGTPAGPGLPEMGSKMAYIVQPGDTLAGISQKVYGNMSRWQEMATLSGMANPSRIYPGDLVYYTLDDASIPFATAYEQVTRSEELVQAGDTLGTIASRVYGSMKGWKAIWRQNDKIDNPDLLAPGATVYYISSSNLAQEVKKQRAHYAALKKAQEAEIAVTADASEFRIDGILLADGRLQSEHFEVRFLI